jgi:alpha-galactosidase
LTFNAHTANASFQQGELWTISLGWSGNTRHFVEQIPDGTKWIGASELLLPGETILAPGQTYASPTLYAVHSSEGFDGVAAKFHDYMRARPHHPQRPRPLTINVWEAVYFDHRFDKLSALADVAASIGVERFVLDDGWFGSRRDDHSGLGDWVVSADAWPEGLHPLAKKLEEVGIEFGLWFEPEMIQVDSDTYRAHPDWVLQVGDRMPFEWREQQVINLANPDAFAHVLGQIDAMLTQYPSIRYLKWDHNRVVIDAAYNGHPVVHAQTTAVYRLFDELKHRHPGLEIESCASGGGRIDLGILDHTDRVWVSDCNDALERQRMQRWTAQVLPPELMGSHIGPHHAHTTGRTHDLTFRALTSVFWHAGLEWDITTTTEAEREQLRSWASYYKSNRELFHQGRMVRVDHAEPAVSIHGVVAHDKSRAIFSMVQEGVTTNSRPQPLRFPGLDPDRQYRVAEATPAGTPRYWQIVSTPWTVDGLVLSGRVLAEVGVVAPILTSEQATLIEITAV